MFGAFCLIFFAQFINERLTFFCLNVIMIGGNIDISLIFGKEICLEQYEKQFWLYSQKWHFNAGKLIARKIRNR
mgnify:CR=1 FL=1